MARFVRKYYDDYVKNIDYEKKRWFKDKASEEKYSETEKAINFHLNNRFKDVLEIGCGPGTWSRILLKHTKNLVLLDISKEMLRQAKKRLKKEKLKIAYVCSDFENFKTKKKFDLIFSSRAIEYMPNKERVIKKINGFLKDGGKVIIITKNPMRRWKHLIFKKDVEKIHKNWISIKEFKNLLEKFKFKKIEIYPAVFSVMPFPNFILTRKLNMFFHLLFYKIKIFSLIALSLESYVVIAYK